MTERCVRTSVSGIFFVKFTYKDSNKNNQKKSYSICFAPGFVFKSCWIEIHIDNLSKNQFFSLLENTNLPVFVEFRKVFRVRSSPVDKAGGG